MEHENGNFDSHNTANLDERIREKEKDYQNVKDLRVRKLLATVDILVEDFDSVANNMNDDQFKKTAEEAKKRLDQLRKMITGGPQ